jgi:DNA-binding transcriptional LysR family regulator
MSSRHVAADAATGVMTTAATGPTTAVTQGARPGDGALRSFVAAARLGSFSVAATELGVTQSAVSHAVARLERHLGVALFERHSSGVTLTPHGAALAEDVGRGFDLVDRALARAVSDAGRGRPRTEVVTLSVSTSFAALWLLPRLGHFRRTHPGIDLRYLTNDSDRHVGRDGADIWIPLGSGAWPDLEAHRLCDEEILLVAAPDVAAAWGDVPCERLVDAPLLHLDERYPSRFDWPAWFAHEGVSLGAPLGGDHSNDYAVVVQAAIAGQGIALGWAHIVAGALADGRLAQVGTRRIRTDRPLDVLVRRGAAGAGPIGIVLRWLLDQSWAGSGSWNGRTVKS